MNTPEQRSPEAADTPQNAAQVLHTSDVVAPVAQNPITVLPWHREAARCAVILALQDQEAAWEDIAEVIASRDPHAETVRLLEDVRSLSESPNEMFSQPVLVNIIREIQSKVNLHLATLQPATAKNKGTQ